MLYLQVRAHMSSVPFSINQISEEEDLLRVSEITLRESLKEETSECVVNCE